MSHPVAAALLLFGLVPQEPDAPMARYTLAGQPAVVSRTDLAIEMAFHLRRRDRGRQTAEQLADTLVTRQAAEQQKLMPSTAEAREFWQQLQKQLQDAGQNPQDFPWVRNSSEAQLLDVLAVQIAQERLVRTELGLGKDEAIGAEMLKLWLQEQKKKVAVVTDPDRLPAGVAVRVGTQDVPLIELGLLLLRTADDDERDRYIRQVAYLAVLDHTCKQTGVEVTPGDLDRALQKRAADAARDPSHGGVSFENVLKAQGLTPQTLRELRTFRGHVQMEKLAQQRFPLEAMTKELHQDRQKALELVGPRRHLAFVFLNALAEPNAVIKRSFEAAEQQLLASRQRLDKKSFEQVARTDSEHPNKQQGGDAGWHRQRSDQLPAPVLAAAFQLGVGEVSMPLRSDEGCFLVKVLATEPEPADAVLVARLQEFHSLELSQQLLKDAAIKITTGTTK